MLAWVNVPEYLAAFLENKKRDLGDRVKRQISFDLWLLVGKTEHI